ncbi:sucrose-6-phosphate hydrolase [Jeotgalibacillus proteolyticus]|uniref:Sucrose-6-phosphate hydrolase n=1 Tax=Jeotgalibacillus proteolyticus TaxID=2082395 RepID=A0A2S5GBF0_9BACL|nr:sucrose-6-phosphate hydrolase [Jeotgalibacillus proteolyticus]PPA70330.1 sucrose-6-phosphate hydrolase [Jeotgalibacillus proteolyticus]
MNRDEKLKLEAYTAVDNQWKSVKEDPYFPGYHLAPPAGLLNDPNGWIQWKGIYHLFFQWLPFETAHGAKFWGHFTSQNLTDWTLEPIALTPSDSFDKNGCYSGSAIDADGKLTLFYTGNVKNEQGLRQSYQCTAESEDGIHFTNKSVKIELPEGFTPHFRDPKVWKHEDHWYMVIGAQTEEMQGSVVLFESADLENWTNKGIISHANQRPLERFGYMWECPDVFTLGDQEVLLFSPQGLKAEGIHFNNQYQSGYVVGELNYKKAKFTHGDFTEIDRGFEFYAPQTTVDKGRRILFGWMGVPDQNEFDQPTVKNGWVHQLTLPRELKLINGHIHQMPLEEMKQLRTAKTVNSKVNGTFSDSISRTSEIEIEGKMEKLTLFGNMEVSYNEETQLLTLERPSYVDGRIECRSCHLKDELRNLKVWVDHSSLEIFVNDGEEVFTSRLFANPENQSLAVCGEDVHLTVWALKNDTVDYRNDYK